MSNDITASPPCRAHPLRSSEKMKQIFTALIIMSIFSKLFGGQEKKAFETAEIFDSMRQQIFDLPKEKIDLGGDDRLAIVMETAGNDYCYTLVAVADGSASIYYSSGGGIIGAGQHPQGGEKAKEFLNFSRQYESKLKEVKEFPLPKPGMTRFYIIKKDSTLTGEFKEDDLGNEKLKLSPLFHKGHELITIIRLIDEQRTNQTGDGNFE